jgi:hypothetical protein
MPLRLRFGNQSYTTCDLAAMHGDSDVVADFVGFGSLANDGVGATAFQSILGVS